MSARAFQPKAIIEAGALIGIAERFLERLRNRGRAANTIIAYQTDLEQFIGFLAARDTALIQTVNRAQIEDWMDALLHGQGISPRSVVRKLEAVRSFFRFAEERGLLTERNSPLLGVDAPKFEQRRVIAPQADKIEAMLRGIPTDTPINIRDRALFSLMYDSALRVGGVLSLDLYAQPEPQCCVRPDGVVIYRYKGGALRQTFCERWVLDALQAWLEVRHRIGKAAKTPALFIGNRGRVSRNCIHNRIKIHAAAAGMPWLHSHLLRHRRAGDVIRKVGIREGSYLLGHASESITRDVYGHEAAERLCERIRREAPINLETAA